MSTWYDLVIKKIIAKDVVQDKTIDEFSPEKRKWERESESIIFCWCMSVKIVVDHKIQQLQALVNTSTF